MLYDRKTDTRNAMSYLESYISRSSEATALLTKLHNHIPLFHLFQQPPIAPNATNTAVVRLTVHFQQNHSRSILPPIAETLVTSTILHSSSHSVAQRRPASPSGRSSDSKSPTRSEILHAPDNRCGNVDERKVPYPMKKIAQGTG